MIDPFEAALADLLADRLATEPTVAAVTRPRDGLGTPPADGCRVTASVVDAVTSEEIGGARPELVEPTRERTTLRLSGHVGIDVEVGQAAGPAATVQRSILWRAADAVLVVLADPEVRSGRVWGDEHDQGFAVDRLACERITSEALPDEPGHRRLAISCAFDGRFWPVVAVAEGGVIEEPIRTRIAVGDPVLPTGLQATSGGADLVVPVRLDLRASGLAEPVLAARLLGSAPPGTLVGDADGVPAGSVGFAADADGVFSIRFRPEPPPARGTATAVLSLAGVDGRPVTVGRLSIDVVP